MTPDDPSRDSDSSTSEECLVCFCHGVLEAEIRKAIVAGARTIADVQERTRASTGCGGCTSEVQRILEKMLGKKPS